MPEQVKPEPIVLKPSLTQTQWQVIKIVEGITTGQVKFRLPAWAVLEQVVLSDRTVAVTFVRKTVIEQSRAFVCKESAQVTLFWTYTEVEPDTWKWVKLEYVAPKNKSDAWRHLKHDSTAPIVLLPGEEL